MMAYGTRTELYEKWYGGVQTEGLSIYAADVDNDGVTEILTSGWDHNGIREQAFLNISGWNATATTTESYTILGDANGCYGRSVFAADVDNDGKTEILAAGEQRNATRRNAFLNITMWNGSALVNEYSTKWYTDQGTDTYSVYAADLDSDTKAEILQTGYTYGPTWLQYAFLNISQWNGSTLTAEYYGTWRGTGDALGYSVFAADIDDDGAPEILVTGYVNDAMMNRYMFVNISSWNGIALTNEYSAVSSVAGTTGYSISAADVDNDGIKEILITGSDNSKAFLNISNWYSNTMTPEYYATWFDNGIGKSISATDIDGDGTKEILLGGYFHDGALWNAFMNISRWNGTAASVVNYTNWFDVNGAWVNSLFATDLNNDGKTEILATGWDDDGAGWSTFLKISLPVFRAINAPAGVSLRLSNGTDVSVEGQPIGIRTVDIDAPGKVASLTMNFSGDDIDFSSLVANVSVAEKKAVLHMPTWPSQIAADKTLYIPGTGSGQVHICPAATTLAEVNSSCLGGLDVSAHFNGTHYDNITVTGTGGMEPGGSSGNVTGATSMAAAPESPLAALAIIGAAMAIGAFLIARRR
jgi:hypothetical protein